VLKIEWRDVGLRYFSWSWAWRRSHGCWRPKYKAALSAAYGAGLRVSEVVALKVSDIDSECRWRRGNSIAPFMPLPIGRRSRSEWRLTHCATMALIILKIALGAGLVILGLGVFPDRRWGAIIAVATCIAAAFVLHFVAPWKSN
jgi:integrase